MSRIALRERFLAKGHRTSRGAPTSLLALVVLVLGVGIGLSTLPAVADEPTTPPDTVAPQVVGGTDATTPWSVSLQSVNADGEGYHECGGVLIAPEWVLSASHCAPYITGLARVGSLTWDKGGELVPVAEVISHPGDNPENFRDDIALVRLEHPVTATPLALGAAGATGSRSLVAGWGTTCDLDINDPECREMTPDHLQQLALSQVDGQECALTDPDTGENLFWDPGMICLVAASGLPSGWCFGDSGSPILERRLGTWTIVGIAIADMDSTTAHPNLCSTGPGGTVNHGAATKVGPYISWIRQTMASHTPRR